MVKELHISDSSCVAVANELAELTKRTPHSVVRDLIRGEGKHHIKRIKGRKARRMANAAQKAGILIKPSACETCLTVTKELNKHHEDYDKPLEIVWLCDSCHGKRFAEMNLADWIKFNEDSELFNVA